MAPSTTGKSTGPWRQLGQKIGGLIGKMKASNRPSLIDSIEIESKKIDLTRTQKIIMELSNMYLKLNDILISRKRVPIIVCVLIVVVIVYFTVQYINQFINRKKMRNIDNSSSSESLDTDEEVYNEIQLTSTSPLIKRVASFFSIQDNADEQTLELSKAKDYSLDNFLSDTLINNGIVVDRVKKRSIASCVLKLDDRGYLSLVTVTPGRFFTYKRTRRHRMVDMDSAFISDNQQGRLLVQFKGRVYNVKSDRAEFLVRGLYDTKESILKGRFKEIVGILRKL